MSDPSSPQTRSQRKRLVRCELRRRPSAARLGVSEEGRETPNNPCDRSPSKAGSLNAPARIGTFSRAGKAREVPCELQYAGWKNRRTVAIVAPRNQSRSASTSAAIAAPASSSIESRMHTIRRHAADWRRCASCARSYGIALSRRWSQVQGLRAFVVVTMPAEGGDWRIEENRRAMMRAWRRLYERLCRRFDRRPKLMHFKEHAGAGGRLHLNVLWDWEWIDQGELSLMAADAASVRSARLARRPRSRGERRGRLERRDALLNEDRLSPIQPRIQLCSQDWQSDRGRW